VPGSTEHATRQLLLHPETAFDHPKDVVAHLHLSIADKRAILASWASDGSAIVWHPALRAPPELRALITIDEILEALPELDGAPRKLPGGKPNHSTCACSLGASDD
jgi:hypothetical protein